MSSVSLEAAMKELIRGAQKMLEVMKEMYPLIARGSRWENRAMDADPIWRASMRYRRRRRNL